MNTQLNKIFDAIVNKNLDDCLLEDFIVGDIYIYNLDARKFAKRLNSYFEEKNIDDSWTINKVIDLFDYLKNLILFLKNHYQKITFFYRVRFEGLDNQPLLYGAFYKYTKNNKWKQTVKKYLYLYYKDIVIYNIRVKDNGYESDEDAYDYTGTDLKLNFDY